jgi:hypothetical protein
MSLLPIEIQNEIEETIRELAGMGDVRIKAILGKPDGTVRDTPFNRMVYITLGNGAIMQIYNDRVPIVPYKKIVIGYDASSKNPNLLQVLHLDAVYDTEEYPNLTNHAPSHRWFDYDALDVFAQQFMPLLPRAAGGTTVRVYGGPYVVNNTRRVLTNTDIDMSAYIPASGAKWVNAEIDDTGAITFNQGDEVDNRDLLLLSLIPSTEKTKKLLFSAKLYVGLENFIETPQDTDIYDPRFEGTDYSRVGGLGAGFGWEIDGALAVLDNAATQIFFTETTSISAIYFYLENTGSSGVSKFDIILNDLCPISIFDDVSDDSPEIAYNDSNQWVKVIPSINSFSEGDSLSLDILQVAPGARGLRVVFQ